MDPSFTPKEIQKALRKLKNNKTIGQDAVQAECIKDGSDKLFSDLFNIIDKASGTGSFPGDLDLISLGKPLKMKNKK